MRLRLGEPGSPTLDGIEREIDVAGYRLRLLCPADPRALALSALRNLEPRPGGPPFAGLERLPYWARLWPSSLALAKELTRLDLRERRVIELGAGLGLAGLIAARLGARVLLTDREPQALRFAEASARLNGLAVTTAEFDLVDPIPLGEFEYVIASDLFYDRALVDKVARLTERLLGHRGALLLVDPWFPHLEFVEAALRKHGLKVESRGFDFEWQGVRHASAFVRAVR